MDVRDNLPELPTSSLHWHIARAQPGQDRTAAQALRNRRYQVYRPIMPVQTRRNHGELRNESRSIFPTYLFVLPNPQGWESLRTAPGMFYGDNALLRLNGSFARILHNDPNRVGIVQIRELEESLWNVEEKRKEPQWRVGDRVHVKKGPFIEMLGSIARLDDTGRVGVLLDILGARRLIYVSAAHIISAEA